MRWQSAQGTRLTLSPLVLHLSLADAERLVATGDPGLALVAAWTVQKKYGPRSARLVNLALTVVDQQPAPLSIVYQRAIVQMLGERLLEQIRSETMDLNELPKSEGYKRFEKALQEEAEERGKAAGKAEGLRVAVTDLC